MQHPELGECFSVLCPLLPSWSHQGHGFREEEDKDKVPMFSLKIISVCHPRLPLPVLTLVGCSSGFLLQLPWGRESTCSQCGSETATPGTLLRSSLLSSSSLPLRGLTVYPRLAWSLQSSSLSHPSAGVLSAYLHDRLPSDLYLNSSSSVCPSEAYHDHSSIRLQKTHSLNSIPLLWPQ